MALLNPEHHLVRVAVPLWTISYTCSLVLNLGLVPFPAVPSAAGPRQMEPVCGRTQ